MILQSFSSMATILLVIGLGYWLQHRGWLAESFAGNIAVLITRIALPASIFVSVLKFLSREQLVSFGVMVLYPLIAVVLGYLVAYGAVVLFRVPAGRRGIVMNTFTNANTVFMGLPLNLALFGEEAMPYFLVYYLLNTLSTFTVGTYLIAQDDPTANGKKAKIEWAKILSPALVAFIVALAVVGIALPVPGFALSALTYVGNLVTPLSLMYIGINLERAGFGAIRFDKDAIIAIVGRFIIAPALLIGVLFTARLLQVPLEPLMQETFIVQSAVPTLVIMPILAAESHGDVAFATNMVTSTTVLFLAVVPLLMWVVQLVIS